MKKQKRKHEARKAKVLFILACSVIAIIFCAVVFGTGMSNIPAMFVGIGCLALFAVVVNIYSAFCNARGIDYRRY